MSRRHTLFSFCLLALLASAPKAQTQTQTPEVLWQFEAGG